MAKRTSKSISCSNLIVMETYAINQEELAEYCRKKCWYKEQIKSWIDSFLGASGRDSIKTMHLNQELNKEKKRSKK